MAHPKVFVDFQNADPKGRIRLSCVGTREDLERQQIELTKGLVLTLYEDDADENNRPQELLVEGVVEYSDEENRWVAVIDWDAIQRVPVVEAEEANGNDGVSATPAATPSPAKGHD